MKTRIIAVLPTDKKFKMSTLYSFFLHWRKTNYGQQQTKKRILQCFHLVLHAHKIQIWLCIKVKPRGNTRIRNSVVLMRIENLSFMFSLWDLNAYVEMTIQLQTHYSHFMVTVILTLYVCTQSLSLFLM